MTTDWVIAFASCITAVGVFFLAFQAKIAADQLILSRKALAADHERSRREKAIEVLDCWTNSLGMTIPSARSLVQELSTEQCKCLIKREPFEVAERYKLLLSHALYDVITSEDELECDNGKIKLNQKHSSHLLALVIHHLNLLEVALLPWMYGVADNDIIEAQFQYLVRFDDGHYVLQNLREVMAGKASFPAIERFVEHMIDKHKNSLIGPKNIIA